MSPSDNLFNTLRVYLAAEDVVILRDNDMLATSTGDTFLVLKNAAVADFSNNPLVVITNQGIQASRLVIYVYT